MTSVPSPRRTEPSNKGKNASPPVIGSKLASILLSERITRGLQRCKQTVVAACGVKKGGSPIGPAGDFRYRTEPTDLVGAAHVRLADLVVNKAEAMQCKGCGRWFRPKHGSQWHHTPECGRNKRRRDSYWKKAV